MKPYLFDEFFSSGLEESISPFLTAESRSWGKNLSLKSASSAGLILALSFILSFINLPFSYLCLSFVYFLAGIPALIASLEDLKNLEINIDVLMTIAAFVAIFLGSSLEGALLLVLFELSHGMEHTVSKKAKLALHNLNHIAPKFAHLISEDGALYEKSVREIELHEKIYIKQGEIAPLDGFVVEGSSSINLVHLTGESLPLLKTVGDLVPAGARNLESALLIEVCKTNSDSTLTRIIQLITQASSAKPRFQQLFEKFSKYYATSIIAFTFLFALTLPLVFSMSYWGTEGAVYRSLSFLIAASPCALLIATPTAYLSAISSCARKGILLKGGAILDALNRCQTIAFDKTGTLTTGELQCVQIEPIQGAPPSLELALSIAYGLERQVVHPIATAICKLAAEKTTKPAELTAFQSIPGFGLKALYHGLPVSIGVSDQQDLYLQNTIVAMLSIGKDRYLFRFTDTIRPEAKLLIEELKIQGLTPIMLTGDHQQNAEHVGSLLGIEQIYASLRPEDKLEKVAIFSEKKGLAMVGDGINDAPALARATVGISMGRIGSATAVDASDVILLNDDLHLLSWLFKKASQTVWIVKQNLLLSLAVIFLATTPALLGFVPLWLAVILHEGGTVLVGLNSLRLLRK